MIDDTTLTEQTPPANKGGRSGQASAYLVVIVGMRVGEMHRLAKDTTILGRCDEADVRLVDEGVSRRHAVLVLDGERVTLKDLGSANGTYRNGSRIAGDVLLTDGDKISIGGTTILKFTYQDDLDQQFSKSQYESAVRDGLTGLHNRRYLDERLHSELTFARRHGQPLAFMLADVDHFKKINDERGHHIGDITLQAVARRLSSALRAEDVIARYGGEEFAILCRNTNDLQACTLADRLRSVVSQELELAEGPAVQVTISIGIALAPKPGTQNELELVKAADSALYEAKRRGRDRSVVFE